MATVLAETVVGLNPECDVLLLVPDLTQAQIDSHNWPTIPSTRLIGLEALRHPLVSAMRRYFDAFELCCALKSVVLQHVLFVEGYDKAAVLDPDIMVYGALDDLWSALNQSDIAVTPHTNSPMPDDGELPDDLEYATAGFVNGGVLAATRNERTEACVAWLVRKVADYGFFAPQFNTYADQTWMGGLPWYFPSSVGVLRHLGVNVAYWNLHERRLVSRDGQYWCGDQRLILFHYSGFDPGRPAHLSRHSRRKFDPDTEAALGQLLEDYAARLRAAAARIPQLVPGRPTSRLSLADRLKAFEEVRGKRPVLSGVSISLARRVARRFRSMVRVGGARSRI